MSSLRRRGCRAASAETGSWRPTYCVHYCPCGSLPSLRRASLLKRCREEIRRDSHQTGTSGDHGVSTNRTSLRNPLGFHSLAFGFAKGLGISAVSFQLKSAGVNRPPGLQLHDGLHNTHRAAGVITQADIFPYRQALFFPVLPRMNIASGHC